jgi:hypothetical protein
MFVCRLDSPPLPKLSINAADGNPIISWPSDTSGFHLENTLQLALPESWQLVTNAPTRIGPRNVLTNRSSDKQRFYRLRKRGGECPRGSGQLLR